MWKKPNLPYSITVLSLRRETVALLLFFFVKLLILPECGGQPLSSQELEQLRALGYVGGVHESAAARQGEINFTPVTSEIKTSRPFSVALPVTNLFVEKNQAEIIEIAGRTRTGLRLPPGQNVAFHSKIPSQTTLLFGAGQSYAQIKPNSLILQLDILDSVYQPIEQVIVSTIAGAWVDRRVDLSSLGNREIRLVFSVKSLDPSQDDNAVFLAPLLLTHPPQNQTMPHVFFVLADTLRADALGCYGQAEPVTPHLDRLARRGVILEQMIAQSPHTETSIPSILQGMYPHRHGRMFRYSRHNAATPEYIESRDLNPRYETLAEVFQNHGYLTYGFHNNLLVSAKYGFHRGFYDYVDYVAEKGISDMWKKIALPTAHFGVEDAIRAVERAPLDVPLFVFLHLLDPHNPYTPPDDFNLSVKKEADKIDEAAYLGEVAFVDEQIGQLIEALERNRLFEKCLFVFTSDHGEEFVNPYGRPIGHGRTLFQTLLHVPFLCVFSGMIPNDSRVSRRVESVDAFPTLLELAGLKSNQPISGNSFVSLLTGNGERYQKTEAIAEGIRRGEERKCLIQNGYKLIYFCDSARTFLYNLDEDPSELQDVAKKKPQIVADMKSRLLDILHLQEPLIHLLQIIDFGQDGWDLVHTFHDGESNWQPGFCDLHLNVKPIPENIARIDIWADDRLHGNRNYMYGWSWPSAGEWPIAVKNNGDSLDLFFDVEESLHGSDIFVRLTGEDGEVYLGSFAGRNVEGVKRSYQSNHPLIVCWDFEKEDALLSWKTGQNGRLSLRTQKVGDESDTFLQFDSDAPSGMFRAFHLIPKVPAGRRVLVSFELVILSGGVKVELIHPQSAVSIASHAFTSGKSGRHVTHISPQRIHVCGVTGIAVENEELLFLLSNFHHVNESTHVFLNNVVISLYPQELEYTPSGEDDESKLEHDL
ncbi:MAG: hypothetical protein C4527_24450 [Candidatus Omnitrophota bacterium]|jgi:arylsulfatase A-like enzyme|nr:MAG: hypothetical protein C4527_24450 [Candidatus Omnitrophota bacterium]